MLGKGVRVLHALGILMAHYMLPSIQQREKPAKKLLHCYPISSWQEWLYTPLPDANICTETIAQSQHGTRAFLK